jgi:hypothetical protein
MMIYSTPIKSRISLVYATRSEILHSGSLVICDLATVVGGYQPYMSRDKESCIPQTRYFKGGFSKR